LSLTMYTKKGSLCSRCQRRFQLSYGPPLALQAHSRSNSHCRFKWSKPANTHTSIGDQPNPKPRWFMVSKHKPRHNPRSEDHPRNQRIYQRPSPRILQGNCTLQRSLYSNCCRPECTLSRITRYICHSIWAWCIHLPNPSEGRVPHCRWGIAYFQT
jgi:hypothetical protein